MKKNLRFTCAPQSLTSDLNYILKRNRLSLYKVDDEGLKSAHEKRHVKMYL